jgi:hypothetical protein
VETVVMLASEVLLVDEGDHKRWTEDVDNLEEENLVSVGELEAVAFLPVLLDGEVVEKRVEGLLDVVGVEEPKHESHHNGPVEVIDFLGASLNSEEVDGVEKPHQCCHLD